MSFRPHIICRVTTFIPRQDRDLARGRRAYATARAQGKPAMDCACAQIEATFGPAHLINDHKRVAEVFLKDGPESLRTRARFSRRAEMVDHASLDEAIYKVDHWYRLELQSVKLAAQFGCGKTRLGLDILREARLILRWLRYSGRSDQWPDILAALTEPTPRIAMRHVAAE